MGQRVLGACVPDVVKMLVPSFFLRSKSRFRTSANTKIYRTSAGADKTGAARLGPLLRVLSRTGGGTDLRDDRHSWLRASAQTKQMLRVNDAHLARNPPAPRHRSVH